ncbi:MAG: shikimate kinase [Lachnospiraceae bacterium]|nr:shikimate kinase [Lachnospiraceae bacterium]
MKNIILIGMPGAGKSTVGIVLAKALGYKFIDTDLVIQEDQGMLLHKIIEKYGTKGFNTIENNVISSIKTDKSVIATGGSAVYGKDAMQNLKSSGIILYLELPLNEIKNRLGNLEKRGVSMEKGQTLETLYNERISLYEKYADITIHCYKLQIREIINTIIKLPGI